VHTLPEGPESDSPAESGSAPEAKPKQATADAAPKEAQKPVETAGDDESEEAFPVDVEGYKRALAATRGDKRKMRKQWQEAEQKLAQLEGQLSVMRQQAQPQAQAPKAEEKPSDPLDEFIGDPNGFLKKHLAAETRAHRDELVKARIETSERFARMSHPDFEEKRQAFVELAQRDQRLIDAMLADSDPAGFAYRIASEHMEFVAWREAKQAAPTQEQAQHSPRPPARTPPKSLANARGTGVGTQQEWSGPRPLSDAFGR
jgi:hypothetical protein